MQIVLEHLTKSFGEKNAVNDVNTVLKSGGLIGLVGRNGAGKTTLLKLLATILKPEAGHIIADGTDAVRQPDVMRKVIGYLPQETAVYPNLTGFEFLNYFASMKGIRKKEALRQIDELLRLFSLSNVQNRRLGGYSVGMKRRVGLACALLGEPKVIVADEPTAGLDPEERIAVRNLLSELGKDKIVILSTHIVSDIEAAASHILILQKGRLIFDGEPQCLMEAAAGKVWEYTLQAIETGLKGVSSMVQTSDGIHIRQVSAEKPADGAVPVKSTLEDACLLAMGE